jgi:hypothetical protein
MASEFTKSIKKGVYPKVKKLKKELKSENVVSKENILANKEGVIKYGQMVKKASPSVEVSKEVPTILNMAKKLPETYQLPEDIKKKAKSIGGSYSAKKKKKK